MPDAEWLRELLEPALAATLNNDSAATAAASSALTALATLEGLLPGSLQSMMLQVTALLACTLKHAKHTASTLHTHSKHTADTQHTSSNRCLPISALLAVYGSALGGCWCSAICCSIADG